MVMADCLDRMESPAIGREEFFNMHNKSSKLITPSTLCISTLGNAEICSENCEKPSTLLDSTSANSDSLEESVLNKDDRPEVEIASGFFVLNNDCTESSPFREKVSSLMDISECEGLISENEIVVPEILVSTTEISSCKDKSELPSIKNVNKDAKTIIPNDLENTKLNSHPEKDRSKPHEHDQLRLKNHRIEPNVSKNLSEFNKKDSQPYLQEVINNNQSQSKNSSTKSTIKINSEFPRNASKVLLRKTGYSCSDNDETNIALEKCEVTISTFDDENSIDSETENAKNDPNSLFVDGQVSETNETEILSIGNLKCNIANERRESSTKGNKIKSKIGDPAEIVEELSEEILDGSDEIVEIFEDSNDRIVELMEFKEGQVEIDEEIIEDEMHEEIIEDEDILEDEELIEDGYNEEIIDEEDNEEIVDDEEIIDEEIIEDDDYEEILEEKDDLDVVEEIIDHKHQIEYDSESNDDIDDEFIEQSHYVEMDEEIIEERDDVYSDEEILERKRHVEVTKRKDYDEIYKQIMDEMSEVQGKSNAAAGRVELNRENVEDYEEKLIDKPYELQENNMSVSSKKLDKVKDLEDKMDEDIDQVKMVCDIVVEIPEHEVEVTDDQEEALLNEEKTVNENDLNRKVTIVPKKDNHAIDSSDLDSEMEAFKPDKPVNKPSNTCEIAKHTNQVVPINVELESRVLKHKHEGKQKLSFANKLESLTGTVKIGCLSVTPLNPCKPKTDAHKNRGHKSDPSDSCSEKRHDIGKPVSDVSVFLKANEKLIKNNVQITISPKPADSKGSPQSYSESALDALRDKIPQLIDKCINKSESSCKPHSEKHDSNKSLIVNKNLKAIESFLIQRGLQKEANILKEKMEVIKPYLEDIALKSVNERKLSYQTNPDYNDNQVSEFTNFMKELSRSRCMDKETTAEKELAALTDKFLSSSMGNLNYNKARHEEYMSQSRQGYHMSGSYGMPDKYMYEQYYGKSYYDSYDYGARKEASMYPNRYMDYYYPDYYRSSRYYSRETDYNIAMPEMSMYDQYLPEFENKVHSASSIGSTNGSFRSSDFSLFVDAYTAEKFNNFIHFMVPESEANAFDLTENNRLERDLNYLATVQPLDNYGPPQNPYWPPSANPYITSAAMTPGSQPPPLRPIHKANPPIGHPLPVDSSKETCSQLTITPLDESGKPYGPQTRTITESCSQPYNCNEMFPCNQAMPAVGMVPPVPALLPSMESLSQQLTITPLHQSSNLPYLHRTSSIRRRGRPPMDPEYATVGFRKDAYANQRFSRSDFMARVRNNVDNYSDHKTLIDSSKISRVPNETTEVETKPADIKLQLDVSSVAKPIPVLPPPVILPKSPTSTSVVPSTVPSVTVSKVISPSNKSTVSESVSETPLTSSKTKVSSSPPPVMSPPKVNATPSAVSNGYKKIEPNPGSKSVSGKRFIEIAPKPTPVTPAPVFSLPKKSRTRKKMKKQKLAQPMPRLEPKPPVLSTKTFQMLSKQVKIAPDALLRNTNLMKPKNEFTNKTKTTSPAKTVPEIPVTFKKIAQSADSTLKSSVLTTDSTPSLVKSDSTNHAAKEEKKVCSASQNISADETLDSRLTSNKKRVDKNSYLDKSVKLDEDDSKDTHIEVVPPESLNLHGTNKKSDCRILANPITTEELIPLQTNKNSKKSTKTKRRQRLSLLKPKRAGSVISKSQGEITPKVAPKNLKAANNTPVIAAKRENQNKLSSPPSVKEQNKSAVVSTNIFNRETDASNESINDSLGDGVRRSGRKRKIIEGNPKFRDMERVDLKYFREERVKQPAVKRKLDPKSLGKLESPTKKRIIITEQKVINNKEHKLTNSKGVRVMKTSAHKIDNVKLKDEIPNTQEKLQQFLDVNDIYLKPQTFV